MNEWKKVKIGDVCKIFRGETGISAAQPGIYPLVVTSEERKTCSAFQFDCEAVCIPLVSSSGHGKRSLKNIHYQVGKFALGTILCAVIPNNSNELNACYLYQYLNHYKDILLVPLMKGVANVSLSIKDILTVQIPLPPIEKQIELSSYLNRFQNYRNELLVEIEKQREYIKKLRQSILQDAIEGKLTAEWRKYHPVIKGNPDFDAESLFEKIQQEKQKAQAGKKQKQLPPIAENEKAFEIPDSWKWVRLGEIIELISGQDLEPSKYNDKEEGVTYLTGASNFEEGRIIINRWTRFPKSIAKKNDILLTCKGSCGEVAIADFDEAHIARQIMAVRSISILSFKYLELLIKSLVEHIKSQAKGLIPGIERNTVLLIPCAIPPLKEQEEIVRIIDEKFAKLDLIEQEIKQRESYINSLKRSIMEEVFEGE